MATEMDNHFGPQLAGHFDFTLLFGQALFEIAPNAILILATPFFAKKLIINETQQVRASSLLWIKMSTAAALVAMYIAKAVVWESSPELRLASSIANSVMSLIASLCILVALYSAHLYSKKLSTFLSLYFSLTMLLDVSLARSYLLRYNMGYGSMRAIAAIQITAAVLKLLLVIQEEIPKTPLNEKIRNSRTAASDSTLGFWGRHTFSWANSLLLDGYRGELKVEDLPQLDEEFDSRRLFDQFSEHWERYRGGKHALLRACLRTITWRFMSLVVPRLCYSGLSLSRPFLIKKVLELISSAAPSRQIANGLIGATILIFSGIAISRSAYERIQYQIKVSIRGILTVALFDKMQRLSADDTKSAAAITLMSTDVVGVEQIIALLHETWATCLELAFGVYILYLFVKAACFLIFIPSILATVSTYYSAKSMATARGQWNEKISDRVQATSTVLRQLKDVKAMGLTSSLSEYLQQKRKDEVQVSLKERRTRLVMFGTAAFNFSVTPVIVLAGARFWTKSSMTASEIFSAYSVIVIASGPLNVLLEKVIMWASSYACITRIQDYLVLPNMEDHRQFLPSPEAAISESEKQPPTTLTNNPNIAFEMKNVTLLSETGRDVLKNVTLQIPIGSLSMMHGTVGSGKSVFLQILLGEIKPSKGKVLVSSKDISFASQMPWLRNQTIRENVVGTNDVAELLYKEIMHCCALDVDLEMLPLGDQTMTGTDGCNLSGGQKQRLGLARSLCIGASIFVLDDVLSSLDASTAATVFDRVFGRSGFLRRRGATIIMTTNRLDLLREADKVFKINENRTIDEQLENDLPYSLDIAPHKTSSPSTTCNDGSKTSEDEKVEATTKVPVAKPSTKAEKPVKDGDLSLYAYLFHSVGTALLFSWIFSSMIAAVAEKMSQIFVKIWYSVAPEKDVYIVGFALTALSNVVLTVSTALFYFVKIVPNLSNELHWRLLSHTMGSTMSWISHTDNGITLNRFSQDISVISQQLPIAFMQFCFILCSTVVTICVFAASAKYTAPVMLLLLVALYVVQYFYLRTSRQLRLLDLATSAPLLTLFKEALSGIQHIRAFGWQEQFMHDCYTLMDRMQKPYYYLLSIQQWLTFVLDISTCFIATILISVSTTMPSSTSETSIGLGLLNLISFSMLASGLIRVWVVLETCMGGLARIRAFCATTPQETDEPNCADIPEHWPSTGRIEIESISASYEYDDGSLHQALDNASVIVEHGEKAGISGRTGSGKSSLFLALLHMIECSGTIRIDGRDIAAVPRQTLRSRITTLTQDGVEVEETVRFNMYPFDGEKPTDDSILDILQSVGLGEYVKCQGGIGETMSNMKFSLGQKQLFFVARGILHHKHIGSKIVMMDEATSSMDYDVDKQIQKLIDEQLKDCTIVLIAHRLHSLDNADVVVKLEAGKVIEVTRRGVGAIPDAA